MKLRRLFHNSVPQLRRRWLQPVTSRAVMMACASMRDETLHIFPNNTIFTTVLKPASCHMPRIDASVTLAPHLLKTPQNSFLGMIRQTGVVHEFCRDQTRPTHTHIWLHPGTLTDTHWFVVYARRGHCRVVLTHGRDVPSAYEEQAAPVVHAVLVLSSPCPYACPPRCSSMPQRVEQRHAARSHPASRGQGGLTALPLAA